MSIDPIVDTISDLRTEITVTKELCRIVDTPRSLYVYLLLENQMYDEIASLTCDPLHYNDARRFADDYLVTEVMRKSALLPIEGDRKAKALEAFWQSEEECRSTNEKLYGLTEQQPPEFWVAQQWIRKILGPLTRRDLDTVERRMRFGPGASANVKAHGAVLSDKYDGEIHLTAQLYPFYRSILGERWWDLRKNPVIIGNNEYTTVPKNAKTDRGICKEPALNSFVQLGTGSVIRDRLLRFGIDLSKQERNQDFARRAYSDGLATIDLSRASDSVAYATVDLLLPKDWVSLLDVSRSPATLVEKEVVILEKYSSMGNGYTFELETLIFLGICLACVPENEHADVSVYGDDIIVPAAYAPRVVEVLNFLGFSTNIEKSFLAGNFFESCGTDWFKGLPVRPFYLNRQKGTDLDGSIPYVVQIANALRLYTKRVNHDVCCDNRFRGLWVALFQAAPKAYRRCLVPESLGDTGFIVSRQENRSPRASRGFEGWAVKHILLVPSRIRKKTMGRLLFALRAMGDMTVDPDLSRGRNSTFTHEPGRISFQFSANRPTCGFEPRRGLFGLPKTSVALVSEWSTGLYWGDRV